MSPRLVRHGWEIAFQPRLLARQYAELKAEGRRGLLILWLGFLRKDGDRGDLPSEAAQAPGP